MQPYVLKLTKVNYKQILISALGLWIIFLVWIVFRSNRFYLDNLQSMGNNVNKSHIFGQKNNIGYEKSTLPNMSTQIKVMTWNLQGLMNDELDERTRAVVEVINNEFPDIVFFQELIRSSYKELSTSLEGTYENVIGTDKSYASYFTGIFYRKSMFKFKDHKVIPFPNTVMDRTKLVLKLSLLLGSKKIHFALVTSHLESLPKYNEERISQLKNCLETCLQFPDKYNVIFGGDLNLEENEDKDVIPENIKDLWIASGSPDVTQYTWDSTQNQNEKLSGMNQQPKVRYDRMYYRSSYPASLKFEKFELRGKQMVKGTSYFPSDHWAILSSFIVL